MIDKKEFLFEYEKMFGKGPEYFKNIAVLNRCKKANSPLIDENKIERQEEAFERMAFETGEERDLLKYVFTHHFEPCDVCVNRKNAENDDCEMDCNICGVCNCPCKNCWISGADENFVLDAEFVKEKIRKEKENG